MLLVCAATAFELAACPEAALPPGAARVVTGVGIPGTFAGLWPPLPPADGALPSLILNIGIAGAYPGTGIAIGDVVLADGEVYGDVGFELPEEPGFRHVAEAEFGRPFYADPLPTVLPPGLRREAPEGGGFRVHLARGCTVNCCAGTEGTGLSRARLFGAGFETMEGAAVAQVGRRHGVPVCEVRAISNVAARRDMRPENIRLALRNLSRYLETCDLAAAVVSVYDHGDHRTPASS